MPLWYVIRGERAVGVDLREVAEGPPTCERDPRCTLEVEAGTEYAELRGVMLACDAVIHRELDAVAALGAEIAARYGGADLDARARGRDARAGRQARRRCSSSSGAA